MPAPDVHGSSFVFEYFGVASARSTENASFAQPSGLLSVSRVCAGPLFLSSPLSALAFAPRPTFLPAYYPLLVSLRLRNPPFPNALPASRLTLRTSSYHPITVATVHSIRIPRQRVSRRGSVCDRFWHVVGVRRQQSQLTHGEALAISVAVVWARHALQFCRRGGNT